jgi:hypothetical protein
MTYQIGSWHGVGRGQTGDPTKDDVLGGGRKISQTEDRGRNALDNLEATNQVAAPPNESYVANV